MRKRRIRITALLMAGFMAFTLAGCGSSGDDSASNDSSTAKESADDAGDDSGEPVTITVLKAEAQTQDAWDEICETYHELNPNITVVVESYDNDLQSVLATRLAAKEDPDIFVSQPYEASAPYVEYSFDLADTEANAQVDPSSIDSVTFDGIVTGVCLYGDAEGLIYNKEVFDELGLEVPTTLDELETVCETLVENGYTPFTEGYKEGWIIQDILSAFMGAEDPTNATAEEINNGTKTFRDLEYIDEFFDFIDLTLKYGTGSELETGYYDQINNIALGNAVMTTQGNWMESAAVEVEPELNIGMAGIPVSHDDGSLAQIEVGAAWAYHVSKRSAHIDEAVAFLDWLTTSDEGRTFIGEGCGKLPLLKGDVPVVGNTNYDAQEALADGNTRAIEQYFHPFGYETSVGEAVQPYIEGKATREETMDALTEKWITLYSTADK